MASNPMQRKARNSFLAGVLITVIILGAVIGFLLYQIYAQKKEEEEVEENKVSVYVLNSDVKSGEPITSGMYSIQDVQSDVAPINAISSSNKISDVCTTDGDIIYARINKQDNAKEYHIEKEGVEYKLLTNINNGEIEIDSLVDYDNIYYRDSSKNIVVVSLAKDAIVAKCALKANTILSASLITAAEEITTDDLREQELNMIVLPTYLEENDYVDIRLTLPSGEDFIVISKKKIIDTNETTMWINMSEEEILTLSNAIVEAYQIEGTKLYANTYVEPGLQETASQTYMPSQAVLDLINSDKNIVKEAKDALAVRYTTYNQHRAQINNDLNMLEQEEAQSKVSTGVQKSTGIQAQQRADYLQELKAQQTTTTNTK